MRELRNIYNFACDSGWHESDDGEYHFISVMPALLYEQRFLVERVRLIDGLMTAIKLNVHADRKTHEKNYNKSYINLYNS